MIRTLSQSSRLNYRLVINGHHAAQFDVSRPNFNMSHQNSRLFSTKNNDKDSIFQAADYFKEATEEIEYNLDGAKDGVSEASN